MSEIVSTSCGAASRTAACGLSCNLRTPTTRAWKDAFRSRGGGGHERIIGQNQCLARQPLGARAPTTWRGGAIVLLVLALLVLPLYSAANAAEKRVESASALTWPGCRASLASCAQQGPAEVCPPRSHWSLSWIKPPGLPELAAALRDTQPSGTGGIRIRLKSAPFADSEWWPNLCAAPLPPSSRGNHGSSLARRCRKRQPHHAQRRVNVRREPSRHRCGGGHANNPLRSRAVLLIAAGIAAFLLTLLTIMPASAISVGLPATIKLGMTRGTIWNGSTDSLDVGGLDTAPFAGRCAHCSCSAAAWRSMESCCAMTGKRVAGRGSASVIASRRAISTSIYRLRRSPRRRPAGVERSRTRSTAECST